MAKGDNSPTPSGGAAAAPNNKMDQYSVMHHLMAQLGQNPSMGSSIAPQMNNGFGQALGNIGSAIGAQAPQNSGGPMGGGAPLYGGPMGGNRFGGGGRFGGMMGGVQPDAGGSNNILGMLGNAGMTGGSIGPSSAPAQPDAQQMFRRRMMGNNVS
jgi:hypothetical protein